MFAGLEQVFALAGVTEDTGEAVLERIER